VRSTKADDYYLTITESKKFTNDDGSHYYKKHKIYLYKEDFEGFKDMIEETTNYIIDKKGTEIISDYENESTSVETAAPSTNGTAKYTDVNFDDI
jgi:hypothetical protein